MLSFRAQRETIDLPGWYPADDPSAENGLHDARDMRVSDRAITVMKARDVGLLTPEHIRRVRKKLGLSQRDAGLIIGGGPNAFQKYEAGDVLSSKAADSVLRLLDNDPARLAELLGEGQMVLGLRVRTHSPVCNQCSTRSKMSSTSPGDFAIGPVRRMTQP